jgi:hypothetical protein
MTSDHALDRHVQRLLLAKQAMITAAVDATVTVIPSRLVRPTLAAPRVVEESEAELEARLQAARDAAAEVKANAERAQLSSRVDTILAGESRRAIRPELPLTVGFNKPDAARARDLLRYDLDSDDRAMRAAERMLSRYHRQLSPLFPALFEG